MKYLLLFILANLSIGATAQTVKILSYNIHHGNPPAKPNVIDLPAIAKVIIESDADIVGIQEVDIHVSRSEMVNQAEKLAELTNMDYYFSKGINLEKGYYGTLILSKHKIVGKRRYDLPMPIASENRSLAIIDVELPNGKRVSLANTHLDLHEENRVAQAHFINELAELYSSPLILVGDLNAKPNSEPINVLERFFKRNVSSNGPTFPNINPESEIDYIMFLDNVDFEWKSYKRVEENEASDHLPLFAEIEFK